jgi:hypothetical protein
MGMSVQVFVAGVKHLFGEQLFVQRVDTEQMFGQTNEHPFATVNTIKTARSLKPSF